MLGNLVHYEALWDSNLILGPYSSWVLSRDVGVLRGAAVQSGSPLLAHSHVGVLEVSLALLRPATSDGARIGLRNDELVHEFADLGQVVLANLFDESRLLLGLDSTDVADFVHSGNERASLTRLVAHRPLVHRLVSAVQSLLGVQRGVLLSICNSLIQIRLDRAHLPSVALIAQSQHPIHVGSIKPVLILSGLALRVYFHGHSGVAPHTAGNGL